VEFKKNGKRTERKLNSDRSYTSAEGKVLKLHGRSLLLIRNVGHLMTNPAILDKEGNEIEHKSRFSLCRCTKSKRLPFCDGSHKN